MDVVGFAAPFGAAGCVAVLTVASQCTAAPFDPNASKEDILDGIEQFGVMHMLHFEGQSVPSFEAAAEEASKTLIRLSLNSERAGTWNPQQCGHVMPPAGQLVNPCEGQGLFLRTSGTTSRPKVVPLQVGQLVQNGHSLGKGLGIGPEDVCLNVMPLFHIGGIAGSIMAVITTGGATVYAPPFKPDNFVDLLNFSVRKPTWYSSVPTIHMAAYNYAKGLNGGTPPPNSLRFIRSGAAALSHEDAVTLRDFWNVPIIPTYSMSELMPIAQPVQGYRLEKPNALGQPSIASLAIVDANLKPTLFGVPGEVAISGATVMTGYLNNPEANMKTFFYIGKHRFMRTGDCGKIDGDGYLTLTGRTKELIKRGGEQVSPLEVEAILDQIPEVKKAICFGVPSPMWGEEVGAAYILFDGPPADKAAEDAMVASIKKFCRNKGMEGYKLPAHNVFVDSLPMTSTKKYIRIGLAQILGVEAKASPEIMQPLKCSDAIAGLRFVLSCLVMFNHYAAAHYSSKDGESGVEFFGNWRSDWPVSMFLVLGGFSLAASMKRGIDSKMEFWKSKAAALQPTYLLVLFVSLIHLLIVCQPDTFDDKFSMFDKPREGKTCSATLVEMPWGVTVITTFLTYALGLQAWFFTLPISWFMLYYAWFNSVYYFCLFVFPFIHNFMLDKRKDHRLWVYGGLVIASGWLRDVVLGMAIMSENGESKFQDPKFENFYLLSTYLFPPLWLPLFLGGAVTCWFYERYRPAEQHSVRAFGWIADCLTLLLVIFVFVADEDGLFAPAGFDTALELRLWGPWLLSWYMPIAMFWLYCLATGQGLTAHVLSNDFLVKVLSPAAYNVYLIHQITGQWYYWITRGESWFWWSYRKQFYWFSPYPLPVPWQEYFLAGMITVMVAKFMNAYVDSQATAVWLRVTSFIFRSEEDTDLSGEELVSQVIRNLTGAEADRDATLGELGLASVGLPVFVGLLNDANKRLGLTVLEVTNCNTVNDLTKLINSRIGIDSSSEFVDLESGRPLSCSPIDSKQVEVGNWVGEGQKTLHRAWRRWRTM